MTLEELKTIDDLSDECREAIENIPPSKERNLEGRVVSAGIAEMDGNKLLIIVGEDLERNPIDHSAVAEIRITAHGQPVPILSYTISRASELNATVLPLSCMLDYSGSMRDKDIDDAIEMHEAIFSIPVGYEAECTIFSVEIIKKTAFTTDRNVLSNAISRDDSFARLRTALFDAMVLIYLILFMMIVDAFDNCSSGSKQQTDEPQTIEIISS